MNKKLSIQDTERVILHTLSEAVQVLIELKNEDSKLCPLTEDELANYDFNFKKLFESVDFGSDTHIESSMFENQFEPKVNPYAYFSKLDNFLSTYNLGVQKNLNESFSIVTNVEKNKNFNIINFKREIKKFIENLKKQDSISKLEPKYIKLCTSLKRPLKIHGFDITSTIIPNITSNPSILNTLKEKLNIQPNNLYSVVYNKSTFELYFVPISSDGKSIEKFYSYLIDKDEFVEYPMTKNTTIDTYLNDLKQITTWNDVVEIYVNPHILHISFQDNLYSDVQRAIYTEKIKKSGIVK